MVKISEMIRVRICDFCGKEYSWNDVGILSIFCSSECRANKTKSKSTAVLKKCEACGVEFFVKKSHSQKIRSCSMSCSKKIKRKTKRKPRKQNCVYCGKEFNCKESHKDLRKTCSKRCMSRMYSFKLSSEKNPNYRHGKCGTLEYSRIKNKEYVERTREKVKKRAVTTKTIHSSKILNIKKQNAKSCAYCGIKFTDNIKKTFDHVIPYSKYGTDDESNIVICCRFCNSSKSDGDKFLSMKRVVGHA